MVRLGTGASALDKLDEVLMQVDVSDEGEEVYESILPKKPQKSSHRNLDSSLSEIDILETIVEEIETKTWRDYMKAARKARDMRLVDEKYAKYGPLKDIVKDNPIGEAFIFKLEKAWSSEIVWLNPIMPWSQAIVVLFMALQAGIKDWRLLILSIILLGMHPHLIILGAVLFVVFKNRKTSFPKRTNSIVPWPKQSFVPNVSEAPIPQYDKSTEVENVDFIVLGTDLGSMFTAALLSRCGRKVLVIDPLSKKAKDTLTVDSDLVEYGCLVKFDGMDFVLGDQTLPGGSQGQLYINQLATALPPQPPCRWLRVGGKKGVHSVISINRGEPLFTGAGIEEKVKEWNEHNVGVKHAGAVIAKLKEASQILSYGQKLPRKSVQEVSLMDRIAIFLKKKLVENQVVACGNLSSVSAENVLNNKAIMGEAVNLRSQDPALYQLLLAPCVARENISPNDVSFMTLATSFCDWLDGRYYPSQGPRPLFEGLTSTIKNSGGSVMKACVEEILVEGIKEGEGSGGEGNIKKDMTKGVRLEDGTVIQAKEGVIAGMNIHDAMRFLPKQKREQSNTFKRLSMLRRARPVVHTLISLDPTKKREKNDEEEDEGDEGELEVISGQYADIPCLLQEENGDILAASQGGAGCGPQHRNWMLVNFPSSKQTFGEDTHKRKISCVVTTEVDEDLVGKEEQFNKSKPLHEKFVKKRLMELFPGIKEHHISKVKVLNPMYRGISSGVASSPETYENAQGVATLFVNPTTEIGGLYFTSSDVIGGSGVKAQMIGASLCVHAVLGYDSTDVLMRQRNAIREIQSHSSS